MSDFSNEGGYYAILGFYYQLLGSSALGTLNTTIEPGSQADRVSGLAELQMSVKLDARTNVFVPEQVGQDLAILAGEQVLLVQFKYSSDPARYPIRLSQMREILRGFAASIEARQDTISGCLLITNRALAPDASRALEWASRLRENAGLSPRIVQRIPHTWVPDPHLRHSDSGDPADTLSAALDKLAGALATPSEDGQGPEDPKDAKKRHDEERDREKLIRMLPQVLVRTHVVRAGFASLVAQFKDFARRHGASPDETLKAQNILVGKWVQQVGEKASGLTQDDLNEAVTGHGHARELTPEGIGTACKDDSRKWIESRDLLDNWLIRRMPPRLEEALTGDSRIIALVGPGGCGKTQLLTQCIRDILSSPDFRGFAVIEWVPEMQEDWLERRIGQWSNRSSLSDPLARLRTANSRSPEESATEVMRTDANGADPVKVLLWVALDGIDEMAQVDELLRVRSIMRVILPIIESANDVRLLLTCRETDKHRYQNLLRRGGRKLPHELEEIPVADFSEQEMLDVVELGLGMAARERVALATPAADRPLSIPTASGPRFPTAVPADPWVAESLSHPRMLGAFIAAVRGNRALVDDALSRKPQALRAISLEFLQEYFRKYDLRQGPRELPATDRCIRILKRIALASWEAQGALEFDKDWAEIARRDGGLGQEEAQGLYNEAASGGLISTVRRPNDAETFTGPRDLDKEWTWRHSFVAEYLPQISEDELL